MRKDTIFSDDSVVPERNPQNSAGPGCASSSLRTSTAPADADLSYFFADLRKKSGVRGRRCVAVVVI